MLIDADSMGEYEDLYNITENIKRNFQSMNRFRFSNLSSLKNSNEFLYCVFICMGKLVEMWRAEHDSKSRFSPSTM